jgi:hypothetical protein
MTALWIHLKTEYRTSWDENVEKAHGLLRHPRPYIDYKRNYNRSSAECHHNIMDGSAACLSRVETGLSERRSL